MIEEHIENIYLESESYRDELSTVDKAGKRIWLYPKKPKGKFYNKRILTTIIFLVVFILGPIVKINGNQAFLFNVLERKFNFFGQIFLPQDFVILGIGMIIFFVFIILFTVIYGRVWCGWLCPQTVFMEMIFRPIENWLEGSGSAQKKFNEAPFSLNKFSRKFTKHLIFIGFSLIISHLTMAYLIGLENTLKIIRTSPLENLNGFIGILAFTGIFYLVFAKLREQVCTSICPYGRLQGVLVNKNTSAVMYDYVRGEPKAKLKKDAPSSGGDCIDCLLCVQVCPMGIDIRNGIQLECTNCTACIDACDDVMQKISKPKGLIKYASPESIETKQAFSLSKRALAYSGVLLILIIIEGLLIFNRGKLEATVLRVPGQLYQENGRLISNLYNAQIVNKSNSDFLIKIKISKNKGNIRLINSNLNLKKGSKLEIVFFVDIEKQEIKQTKTPLIIEFSTDGEILSKAKTNFMGPINQ